MRKISDLTLPIVPHWRCPIKIEPAKSIKDGDAANVTHFDLQTHWYTHIDAPLHQLADGKTLNDFPLEILVDKAVLLDVSYVQPHAPITAEMLKKALDEAVPAGQEVPKIVIVKTCWEQKTPWQSYEYWDNAPFIADDAAQFLYDLHPNVVGFDFPQDYDIRRLRTEDEHNLTLTTHIYLLKKDILMIEYMTNLWSVKNSIVDFVGLPTALENADGAQIRCIAIEDVEDAED